MNRDFLFKYAEKKYNAQPEYLWKNLPSYAVLRHKNGNKWFALVMNVPGIKLGLESEKNVDILELKIKPEYIGSLRKKTGIFPAYHMNKEHWISLLISGPLSHNEIYDLLSESYNLTLP